MVALGEEGEQMMRGCSSALPVLHMRDGEINSGTKQTGQCASLAQQQGFPGQVCQGILNNSIVKSRSIY